MTTTTSTTLLHIDASPRGERSQSRQLGRAFLDFWRKAQPEGRIISRDIGREPPPFVSEAWVEGAFAPAVDHSHAAREAIAVSDRYIDELLSADQIVITTPVYNFSLPAALKAWIDQVVRVGRTFAFGGAGFEGLAKDKRVIVIVASGSDFRPSTPGGAYNFLEPYLRAVFGFMGIKNVEFVYAHSLNNGNPAGTQAVTDARISLSQLAVQAA